MVTCGNMLKYHLGNGQNSKMHGTMYGNKLLNKIKSFPSNSHHNILL